MTDTGTTTVPSPPQPLRMTVAVALMAVLVLFLLAGAFPVQQGAQTVVFKTPAFIGLLALLCVSLAACCIRRRFSARHIGFHLVHAGVVCILAGAAVGFLAGRSAEVVIPVASDHSIAHLPTVNGSFIPLGFNVGVTRFTVETYNPDYQVFRPKGVGDNPDFEFVRTVRAGMDGVFVVSPSNHVHAAELQPRSNEWVRQHVLDNGWILQKAAAVPRHFQASLRFSDMAGAPRDAELSVNHPVTHRDWRFYLMSYQEDPELCVVLTARNDPGRRAVIGGVYALMAGTCILCFRKARSRHAGA